MSIEQQRALVTGRIWQAVAKSGVDLSTLPQLEQEKLVAAITDGLLLTVDELLGEAAQRDKPAAAAAEISEGEQVVWEGRPFLSLFDHYIVTTERIRIHIGAFSKEYEDIELVRLQDIDHSQTVGERMLNIGDITLNSADSTEPVAVLRNVHNPADVREIIRRVWLDARKRYGFQFREQM